jgi:hypothetical protein
MQNHSFEKNMLEDSIFHCFCSKFKVSNDYFLVKNKHLSIIFLGLISKEASSPSKYLIKQIFKNFIYKLIKK